MIYFKKKMKKLNIIEKYKDYRDSLKVQWMFKRYTIKNYILEKLGYQLKKNKKLKKEVQLNNNTATLKLITINFNKSKLIIKILLKNLLKIFKLIENFMIKEKYFY
jgi:hypothetical protein